MFQKEQIYYSRKVYPDLNIILSQTLEKLRCKFARLPFEPVFLYKQKNSNFYEHGKLNQHNKQMNKQTLPSLEYHDTFDYILHLSEYHKIHKSFAITKFNLDIHFVINIFTVHAYIGKIRRSQPFSKSSIHARAIHPLIRLFFTTISPCDLLLRLHARLQRSTSVHPERRRGGRDARPRKRYTRGRLIFAHGAKPD